MGKSKDKDKVLEVMQQIRKEHCYTCGTQLPYCHCIYEEMVDKLSELMS